MQIMVGDILVDVELIEHMRKAGLMTKHGVELAKKMEEKNMHMALHVFEPIAYLAAEKFKLPTETLVEFYKLLPRHPYFLTKFMSVYHQRVMETVYEGYPIFSETFFKKRENYEEEKETISAFYAEVINGLTGFEDKLINKIVKNAMADQSYLEALACAAGFATENNLLVFLSSGKEDITKFVKKTTKKETIRGSAKMYVDVIGNKLIMYCLKYRAEEEKPAEKDQIVKMIEDLCVDLKQKMHLVNKKRDSRVSKVSSLSIQHSLEILLDHTKTEYIQSFVDPEYCTA